MSERCPGNENPARFDRAGSRRNGGCCSRSRGPHARIFELAPKAMAAMQFSMLATPANGSRFAFSFGCEPHTSDERSIARLAAGEVRQPLRFAAGMVSL